MTLKKWRHYPKLKGHDNEDSWRCHLQIWPKRLALPPAHRWEVGTGPGIPAQLGLVQIRQGNERLSCINIFVFLCRAVWQLAILGKANQPKHQLYPDLYMQSFSD